MFDNLTKEIIYYSLIPVIILALTGLVLILMKKKNENKHQFGYVIKVILMLIDSMVLSLLVGYSVWATARFIRNGTLFSNIVYVIIFMLLIAALIVLLVITCKRIYTSFKNKETFD